MKVCPACKRMYSDITLGFCLDDGTPLSEPMIPNARPLPNPGRSKSRASLFLVAAVVIIALLAGTVVMLLLRPWGKNSAVKIENNSAAANAPAKKPTPKTSPSAAANTAANIVTNSAAPAPPVNPDVPRFNDSLDGYADARRFAEFIFKNEGKIVYLDVQAADDKAAGEMEGETPYLVLYEECTDLDKGEKPSSLKCSGTEYNIRKTAKSTDFGFYYTRGTYKLSGYFAILGSDGPHQGLMGVTMKPVNIEDVGKTPAK